MVNYINTPLNHPNQQIALKQPLIQDGVDVQFFTAKQMIGGDIMRIQQIGTRGTLFTFEDETAVYLINTDHRLFLCDTHCGPLSMDPIKQYIAEQGLAHKELFIFNTHSDWDHIWGNCAFDDVFIIGHTTCRQRMEERSDQLKMIPSEYQKGAVEIRLPNLTFDNTLTFEDDNIVFSYAPGHTVCSSICLDRKDSVAFVGDLVERPLPYVLYHDLKQFIASLEKIKHLSAQTIISAHSGIVTETLIDENIMFLQKIMERAPLELDEPAQQLYDFNIKHAMILTYEAQVREKLGEHFNYTSFLREFLSAFDVPADDIGQIFKHISNHTYEEIEDALQRYIAVL